ncbi:galactose oxidase-like domain-containing protein [Actinophytocola gossypii]|uniref:DUF1929 domain-containing protein n=1 Tax=Actinophytocola gossypii TaxID=2812003 RepID=A0ABT2JCL6_9PSEU|nr:galactose oxidase-like domain-containing protein [Actinophytocola gossypii]MCT2585597.1 DUF1929 domain-containing protein [Actinophytocola gossypii]
MPEFIDAQAGVPTAEEHNRSLTRRAMVVNGAVVAGAGLLASQAVATADHRRRDHDDHDDRGRPSVSVRPERLSLRIDNSAVQQVPGEPVPLLISTTSAETRTLRVSSETAYTTVGLDRLDGGGLASVDVQVTKDAPVTVWVVPHKVGPHSQPADWITVSDGHGRLRVEAWIEPTAGQWVHESPNKTPLGLDIVAVHAALMRGPDGPEVVMYSPPRKRDEDGNLKLNPKWDGTNDRWCWDVNAMTNPESRTLDLTKWTTRDVNPGKTTKPLTSNIFCSGASHLPDGRLLVAGGHVHAADELEDNGNLLHCYDPKASPRWTPLKESMEEVRWYPTVTPLPDGRMLISCGSREGLWFDDSDYFGNIHNTYVVYDGKKVSEARMLVDLPKDAPPLATYPGVFVLPVGKSGTMIAVVETNRAWLHTYQTGGVIKRGKKPLYMTRPGSRSYPWYGSMVMLPLHPRDRNMAILAVGGTKEGSTNYTNVISQYNALPQDDSAKPEVAIQGTATHAQLLELALDDQGNHTGQWRSVKAERARVLCDATLLADGTILVTGGAQKGWANDNSEPVKAAEIFDPNSKTFRLAATATTERRYHSVALLLPDGTVLKAGSNGGFGGPSKDDTQKWFRSRDDAEIYQPPYLWRGPRPSIDKVIAPSPGNIITVDHGATFTVLAQGPSLDAHSKVALIRLGATTHGNNMEQRYVWLTVSQPYQTGGKWSIRATAPDNKAAAPPGDYMLVVVDSKGVPSKAQLVRMSNRRQHSRPHHQPTDRK